MYLDDSACNLASLNLRKFVGPKAARTPASSTSSRSAQAVEMTILGQEIIVGNAKYPTERIRDNSHRFRPLGLGYANLGALLMSRGLPYDSASARAYAGAITSLMTGWAYRTSAVIARDVTGPFDGYAGEPRAVPRRDGEASARGRQDRRRGRAGRHDGRRARRLGSDALDRPRVRLPQRPGDGAGADGDHRLHDGLRHHRHRAGHRAHQVQAAGGRRHDQDRQQHDPRGARPSSATTRARRRRSSTTSTSRRPSRARRA